MSPTEVGLALLVFSMIATRPFEERRWRAGRLSHRDSALLVVGRLPVLAGGFALITGREPAVVVLMAGIGAALAALAYPLVVGRLRRVAGRG